MLKQTLCAAAALVALLAPTVSLAQDAAPAPSTPDAAPAPQATPSAEYVLANLTSVSPLNLIYVVSEEWAAGNRLQAAFWYYIWQIRTEPWAVAEQEFAQPRAAINQSVGATINSWIFSDPELMQSVSERAISYEPKLPMWTHIPEGMPQNRWDELVATTRATYVTDLRSGLTETPPDQIRVLRQQNGLPVGPLTDQGAPLPEEWR